jgi:hypothetical protein
MFRKVRGQTVQELQTNMGKELASKARKFDTAPGKQDGAKQRNLILYKYSLIGLPYRNHTGTLQKP